MVWKSEARRFASIECKSFDFVLEDKVVDLLCVTKMSRERKMSIFLSMEEFHWLVSVLNEDQSSSYVEGWFRRWRHMEKTLLFAVNYNPLGYMCTLMEVNQTGPCTIIFPMGADRKGWNYVKNCLKELRTMASWLNGLKQSDKRAGNKTVRKKIVQWVDLEGINASSS